MPATDETPDPATGAAPATVTDRATAHPRLFWFVVVIAVAVIALDQATKWWAESALGGGEMITVIKGMLSFWLVYNSGAAFSIGEGFTWVFTILAGIAAVAIAWYAWRVRSRWWMIALGLLLGGAITHFGDRLFRKPSFGQGHVVDFIAYGNWFVGNVADIALVLGAIMIAVLSLVGVHADSRAGSQAGSRTGSRTDEKTGLTAGSSVDSQRESDSEVPSA